MGKVNKCGETNGRGRVSHLPERAERGGKDNLRPLLLRRMLLALARAGAKLPPATMPVLPPVSEHVQHGAWGDGRATETAECRLDLRLRLPAARAAWNRGLPLCQRGRVLHLLRRRAQCLAALRWLAAARAQTVPLAFIRRGDSLFPRDCRLGRQPVWRQRAVG